MALLTSAYRSPHPAPNRVCRTTDHAVQNKAAEFGDDASLKGGNNFLAKLLLMEKEGKVTSRETQQAIGLNIGAGSHTTANALSPILYYLYTNPRTLQCLREELDICVKVGPLSFQQSQSMLYLQAVIKEALRLHPGVGTQLTRVVPKVGLVIEGQFFLEAVSQPCLRRYW